MWVRKLLMVEICSLSSDALEVMGKRQKISRTSKKGSSVRLYQSVLLAKLPSIFSQFTPTLGKLLPGIKYRWTFHIFLFSKKQTIKMKFSREEIIQPHRRRVELPIKIAETNTTAAAPELTFESRPTPISHTVAIMNHQNHHYRHSPPHSHFSPSGEVICKVSNVYFKVVYVFLYCRIREIINSDKETCSLDVCMALSSTLFSGSSGKT